MAERSTDPLQASSQTYAIGEGTRLGSILFDQTVTAARLHSVGRSGTTWHGVRLKRRREDRLQRPTYGSLENLFVKEDETEQCDDDEETVIVQGGSLQAAAFGIIKGTVGPAILYLPRGIQSGGYAIAIPCMITATALYILSAYRLLACWKAERLLQEEHLGPESSVLLTYPELARRALGYPYSLLVDFGIASMQYGVCLTYLIFVPANLHQCTGVAQPVWLALMVLLEIPLTFLEDIRKLTVLNVTATLLIAFGLGMVLVLAIKQAWDPAANTDYTWAWQENYSALPAVTDTWFLFVGTSFFMMEGSITLLVPLQEAVVNTQADKFPILNQKVTSWIVVFYILFSFTCLAAWNHLQTALTASLPPSLLATVVQLAYSVAVIGTFPLQAFPALQVTCQLLPWKRQRLGTITTIILGVIAYLAMDSLGHVVSLLGSLLGIPLALIFPPLLHQKLVAKEWQNYLMMVAGVCATATVSLATVRSWDNE